MRKQNLTHKQKPNEQTQVEQAKTSLMDKIYPSEQKINLGSKI